MTMKKYLNLFEAAPMSVTSTALPASTSNVSGTTNQTDPAAPRKAMQAVRPGSASAYVGGPNDPTMPDTSTAIPGTGSKPVNSMQDFEEGIEETVEEELAEMMRLSGLQINEKAPPGAKAERMVKHIKKGYAKDGKLSDKEKSIAFATAWKAKKAGKLDEGVNFVEMMRETEQTLEEMLTELHDEITEYKMTGHMGDKLRDAMELHRYNKNKLMGEANKVYEDDELNELAALAGLEEGFLDDVKTAIDKATLPKAMHADYDRYQAQKARQEYYQKPYVDDAGTIYGPEGHPESMPSIKAKDLFDPKPNRDRDMFAIASGAKPASAADKVNMPARPKLKETKGSTNSAGELNECGDMGMDTEDRLNVSTNMSSDGTKSVNISAQGDKADALLQMLKMAGIRPHDDHDHSSMLEPGVIMIGGKDGMMEQELEEAKKRTTRYVNTPDEEYQTVASITRQGNDLNREKKQFAKKARLGDNPMAESTFDADLDAMLESILIREQEPKIDYDEVKQRVRATFPPPKQRDPASQEIPMEPESPESRVTGPRSMKIPGERTGTENFGKDKEVDEGWEDIKTGVSNAVGDFFNTEPSIRRRSQQYQDLEKMQQNYKPGTPEYDQLEMRKDIQRKRYYDDKGEVVDKAGEPIKVLPPEQWKGGK